MWKLALKGTDVEIKKKIDFLVQPFVNSTNVSEDLQKNQQVLF